jgi:hypothetical protein
MGIRRRGRARVRHDVAVIASTAVAWALLTGCAGGASADSGSGASFGPGGGVGDGAEDGGTVGSVGGQEGGGSADGDDTQGQTSGVGGNDGGENCVDTDGDGYGPGCLNGEDCVEDDPNINPGAGETCDGVDENCDGMIDNGCECPNDGISGNCDAATDLGTLMPGDTAMGVVGNVPQEGSLDWYTVGYPAAARPGEGTPTISFAINEGDAFVFDVVGAACEVAGTPCSSGGTAGAAIALTDWSFVDDVPDCCTPPDDSMVPWPNQVFIRVYRTTMGPSCATYQLQVSR